MTSDKKPVIKGEETYGEDAQYVPNNSVADKKPSGGKVVRVSENKGRKIRLKLTEEQILTWNDNKNYMDKTISSFQEQLRLVLLNLIQMKLVVRVIRPKHQLSQFMRVNL